LIVSADAELDDQCRRVLSGMAVESVADDTELGMLLVSRPADVVIVGAPRVPEECFQLEQRPAIVWLAPDGADGPADAILPAVVSDRELRQCVELIGSRTVLWREIEALARKVEHAFGSHQWRGGGMWQSPGELVHMAITDPLTGLFNRRYLDQVLQQEFDRHRLSHYPLSVLVLDLDNFKEINDRWAHRVGDGVLCQVVARLRQATRGSDRVFRCGGDEFAVVAPGSDVHSAIQLAERLHKAITATPYMVEDRVIALACSLGVASSPDHMPATPSDLLHYADLAMFTAKREGNLVCGYCEQMSAVQPERAEPAAKTNMQRAG
jgi:diguanylate cyclase (GGDEF)-like protein